MSKSANYKKVASRLRNELRNRNSSNLSNEVERNPTPNREVECPPSGLKGREIGMWYAQRNNRKQDQERADGVEGQKRTKMVDKI